MEAGRDLDAEVSRKLFREVVMLDGSDEPKIKDLTLNALVPVPHYSTDTDDSYRILRHYQTLGYTSEVSSAMKGDTLIWTVKLMRAGNPVDGVWGQGGGLAHAVCIAGLALYQRLKG